jgi:hypothetical protein
VKSLAWLACATLLVAVACGSDPEDDTATEPFLGTWTYTEGTESTDCAGAPSSMQPLMGMLTVSRGQTSPLIMMIGADCRLAMDVAGPIATARPSPPCMVDGGSVKLTFSAYTFAVSGAMATETRAATAQAMTPQGPVDCSYHAMGMLKKM